MEIKKLSPMMQHYFKIKNENPDIIIFYRLGDFYELFFDDAVLCSKLLDLILTEKACGDKQKAPMCGVPAKSCETYLRKLIELGYKVGICEQLSEPTGKSNEIVKRDIIRIVTPGTIMEEGILEEKANNFIACVYKNKKYYTAFADLSTGEAIISSQENLTELNSVLLNFHPAEILSCGEALLDSYELACVKFEAINKFSSFDENNFKLNDCEQMVCKQFKTSNLKVYEITENGEIIALGALFNYLHQTQKRDLDYFNTIKFYHNEDYMFLDMNTKRNLELTETFKDRKKRGSLLWILDETKTSMGGRLLRQFIDQPIRKESEILYRQNAIAELYDDIVKRENLLSFLSNICDLERLSARISYGSLTPRDCLAILNSVKIFPQIKNELKNVKSEALKDIYNNIGDFSDIAYRIENCIKPDFETNNFKEGHFIKDGFDAILDGYRSDKTNATTWISELETQEKNETGIKNLRIIFNNNNGYSIEVLKSQKQLVPYRYEAKQTLLNAERYTTPELKELENKVLTAEKLAVDREIELCEELKIRLKAEIKNLQVSAKAIALLDVITSLSSVAVKRNYVRPNISKNVTCINIIDGRHPVVEALLKKNEFVANDTYLDDLDNRTMIITGPNMAGKSTYMRQVALITFMAHIGSFVPAKQAEICLVDRIFTRIGASDDLVYGQSTFMVEMTEVANILAYATDKSLIILDEIGRGTATYDGLSIAQSVMEYISQNLHAKTLFSTHYHELTELEGVLDGVKNYRISVKEFNNDIIFLRKIVRGGALRSFGIEVANLAGLPKIVIDNAKQILKRLEEKDVRMQQNNVLAQNFNPKQAEIVNIIKDIDINRMSPLEAFSMLSELKEKTNE